MTLPTPVCCSIYSYVTEKLRRLEPDTAETRTLQFLVEGRRKLVNDKTRYSNRLTACLKMYFPQVLEWFNEVSSQITGDFLERWPTLQNATESPAGYSAHLLDSTSQLYMRKH